MTQECDDAPSAPARRVEMFTDGACSGNPGPGGWGVVLRWGSAERELWGGEAQTTNNRMELMAVIQGLEILKRPVSVTIHTDSRYVHDGITGWIHQWKRNGWRTAAKKPVKNADLWQRLDAALGRHAITWTWVKGHAGHPENERADALARRGTRAQRADEEGGAESWSLSDPDACAAAARTPARPGAKG